MFHGRYVRAIVFAIMVVAIVLIGYGYWHIQTHATFSVHLAYKADAAAVNRLSNGQLEFLDDDGSVLARASIDTRKGVVWLAHPEHGQCGPDLASDAYQACIKAQATWIPQWAGNVRLANIALEKCSLSRRRVQLTTRRDNLWLWWLPLPRAERLPYTRYSASIAINSRGCGQLY